MGTTQEAAARHRIPARRGGFPVAPRALLRCRCEGPFVEYPNGKIACSRLTPLEKLPMPVGYLHFAPDARSIQHSVSRPLPPEPLTPARLALLSGRPQPSSTMRRETENLEAEVHEMERRLGYRSRCLR